ncbi:hypothetical protein ANDA3_4180 [plant metagenome]|uniref:Uncharacterized protein n=1 Tax=plant metagenome TaxID=1297885 RepID=A0A484QGG0_9ZZZZ
MVDHGTMRTTDALVVQSLERGPAKICESLNVVQIKALTMV